MSKKNVFTKRELQIIGEVAKGKTSQDISEKLEISIHTVNTHRRKALKKVGVSNTISLLNYCEKENISI